MPVTRATAPRGVSTGFRMWKARLVPSAAIAMGTAEKARVVALRKRLGGRSHWQPVQARALTEGLDLDGPELEAID